MSVQFSSTDLNRMFELLNQELKVEKVSGEVYLVGGAVMCLVFGARPTTKDVDAYFKPSQKLREAAAKVASQVGVKDNWMNDAVKGFLSRKGTFDVFLELSHLKIFSPHPGYLLAMKCLALRIGEEFHDIDDIRYLIRHLNLEKREDVLNVMKQYYPLERYPQKTFYFLEELFEARL
jgi:hypothetical protein